MSALEMGAKRGREYLRRTSLETLATMTLDQYCAIGRLDARQHYKVKKAQDDYARGWFQVATTFLTLFKPDDKEQFVAEQDLERINSLLKEADEKIHKLLKWRKENVTLYSYLDQALGEVEEARSHILDVSGYLKRSQSN